MELARSLAAGQRLLLSSPTGSGKSLIEAHLIAAGFTLVVPGMDIADGIARSAGWDTEGSENARRKLYEAGGLWTYKRYHSYLSGTGTPPAKLAIDEAHHGDCNTIRELIALARNPTTVGLTATAFRGTPAETEDLHSLFHNNVVQVITLADSIAKGYTCLPEFDVWPLVDDELIDVTGGEFNVRKSQQAAVEQAPNLVQQVVSTFGLARPITVVLPTVESCEEYETVFERHGLPTVTVVAGTRNRQAIFRRVLAREAVLLQVRAVGEGTDLALRVMVDAAPTMSPVLWMQRVGRLTRPRGWVCHVCTRRFPTALCTTCVFNRMTDANREPAPSYVATNHNLMRHAYLFEGLIPAAQMKKAVTAWPNFNPSRRTMARALGLSGFGRFEPCTVPLADGTQAFMYALRDKTGCEELAALLIPGAACPMYFRRSNRVTGHEAKEVKPGLVVQARVWAYGKWVRVDKLPTLEKCASLPASPCTPAMLGWWQKSAGRFGLDAAADGLTGRSFAALPILNDSGVKLCPTN